MKLFCGPGLDIIVAGRVGPGPHNSICGPGPGQVFTTAADPGRAWASNHVAGPGPRFQARAGPYWVVLHCIAFMLIVGLLWRM